MKFSDIPQYTRGASYSVNISWIHLKDYLVKSIDDWGLDINPDFQREHVWTKKQQSAYVEYILRGGRTGKEILTNHPHWQSGKPGEYVLVDGKQRLTAVLKFLANELVIFNQYVYADFQGIPDAINAAFKWSVNELPTRRDVLQWYLELNSGGTVHTDEELFKVKKLLEAESK